MSDFKYDWFSNNIGGLTTLLARFKDQPGLKAIEVGCYDGRSTCWFLENIVTHQTSQIICIDHFKGGADHKHFGVDISGGEERFLANTKPFGERVLLMNMESSVALKALAFGSYGAQFVQWSDFIYLDGSHLAADVLEDAVLSWRLLKPGGILIFDDYQWRNMPDALDNPYPGIDAFLTVYKGKYKELMRGYQVAVEKV